MDVLYAMRSHIKNLLRNINPDSTHTQFGHLKRVIDVARVSGINIGSVTDFDYGFYENIKYELNKRYPKGTASNTLDAYRRWYVFGADQEFDGFEQECATYLANQVIGGNEKGQAVLSQDPDEGPLRFVEMATLQGRLLAMLQSGTDLLDEALVTWLCLSFGVYPAAIMFLNEEDLIRTDLSDGSVRYELRIPRLKKRGVGPRDQFHTRPVDPRIGKLFERKIRQNHASRWVTLSGYDGRRFQLPMFPAPVPNEDLVGTDFEEHALRSRKWWFSEQLRHFVEHAGLQTEGGSPLSVTPRRLRYTFATRLTREGASPAELADALDHTDLQNVMVYFNSRSDAVISLDKAFALRLARVAQMFLGMVIKDESEALRHDDPASRIHFADPAKKKLATLGSCGTFGFCGLHAPLACYTCFKFQPWLEGPHEMVLDALLEERNDLLARGRDLKFVEANDMTILAVAETVRLCRDRMQTS
ncbi:tyrosine-type recombinase/integrase [Ralstonia chuxiongensis]|uniref:tyrosine-type recombinase/integrase n=1 Tax=Ralstonia chuxiongensis TaxID=2957504 RepID=UPI00292DEA20|nr:tyrosine-type recombinase/integrase [Ralstonia chuxiongensis]